MDTYAKEYRTKTKVHPNIFMGSEGTDFMAMTDIVDQISKVIDEQSVEPISLHETSPKIFRSMNIVEPGKIPVSDWQSKNLNILVTPRSQYNWPPPSINMSVNRTEKNLPLFNSELVNQLDSSKTKKAIAFPKYQDPSIVNVNSLTQINLDAALTNSHITASE